VVLDKGFKKAVPLQSQMRETGQKLPKAFFFRVVDKLKVEINFKNISLIT
jgi:hypothetical protein